MNKDRISGRDRDREIRRMNIDYETIGKYKKLFFQIFVNFVLHKIYQKG